MHRPPNPQMRSPTAANGRANRILKASAGLGCSEYNEASIKATNIAVHDAASSLNRTASSTDFRLAPTR